MLSVKKAKRRPIEQIDIYRPTHAGDGSRKIASYPVTNSIPLSRMSTDETHSANMRSGVNRTRQAYVVSTIHTPLLEHTGSEGYFLVHQKAITDPCETVGDQQYRIRHEQRIDDPQERA